ncbi:MAG: hypothetical protein AMXMBFR33_71840 [Candidatus Xenobia bacterium]
MQDRAGPVTGCLEALGSTSTRKEALSRLPQARGASLRGARAALGRQGELTGCEMLDVGVATLLCQGHPSRFLEILTGVQPAYMASVSATPIGSGSAQDFALSSITRDFRNQLMETPQLVSNCRSLSEAAALLGHTATMHPSGLDTTRQGLVKRYFEEGPPEAAALVAELDRQGVLSEGLPAFAACTQELDRHANLALGLLQRAEQRAGRAHQGGQRCFPRGPVVGGRGAQRGIGDANRPGPQSGGEHLHGRLDDRPGGPRPSIGGIMLPRRRTS